MFAWPAQLFFPLSLLLLCAASPLCVSMGYILGRILTWGACLCVTSAAWSPRACVRMCVCVCVRAHARACM